MITESQLKRIITLLGNSATFCYCFPPLHIRGISGTKLSTETD